VCGCVECWIDPQVAAVVTQACKGRER
jgi:hypothetical protein